MKKWIHAATDFRMFDGYSIDELEELFPDLYEEYLHGLGDDVLEIYLPRNEDNDFIGAKGIDGKFAVTRLASAHKYGSLYWIPTTLAKLSQYLQ